MFLMYYLLDYFGPMKVFRMPAGCDDLRFSCMLYEWAGNILHDEHRLCIKTMLLTDLVDITWVFCTSLSTIRHHL